MTARFISQYSVLPMESRNSPPKAGAKYFVVHHLFAISGFYGTMPTSKYHFKYANNFSSALTTSLENQQTTKVRSGVTLSTKLLYTSKLNTTICHKNCFPHHGYPILRSGRIPMSAQAFITVLQLWCLLQISA